MEKYYLYAMINNRCHYFLIAESHLSPGISGNVHTTQKHSLASLVFGGCLTSGQLGLYSLMVLFIDHVVHAVTVYEEILLQRQRKKKKIEWIKNFLRISNLVVGTTLRWTGDFEYIECLQATKLYGHAEKIFFIFTSTRPTCYMKSTPIES